MSYSDDMKELADELQALLKKHEKAHRELKYNPAEYRRECKAFTDRWKNRGWDIYDVLVNYNANGIVLDVKLFNMEDASKSKIEVKL